MTLARRQQDQEQDLELVAQEGRATPGEILIPPAPRIPKAMRRCAFICCVLLLLLPDSVQSGQARGGPFEAYMKAGKAALETGDYEHAVTYFEKAIEKAPDSKIARTQLEAAVRARGQAHGRSEALAAAGKAALAADEFDKAVAYFEKALDLWSDNMEARGGLVSAFQHKRDSEKTRALRLGRLYESRGQWEDAKQQYLNAVKADPDDAEAKSGLKRVLSSRPIPSLRSWLKGWTDAVGEFLSWLVLALIFAFTIGINLWNWPSLRRAVEVIPFDGPDPGFKQGVGSGMAAIAASQLKQAGLSLERGVVSEPLTALSAKLTDPQAKMLADVVAWFLPPHGFRLEAVVYTEGGQTGIIPKLTRLKFWPPREKVIDTTAFRGIPDAPVHETLARQAAAWAEWHVTHN